MKVYTIFDRVAKDSGPLFTAKNDEVAVRSYRNVMVAEKVNNPDDYMLVCLGEFDVEQPLLFGDKVPTFINTSEDDDE